MNCTAQFTADGRLKLWAPTQVPSVLRHVAARYAGIDASLVDSKSRCSEAGSAGAWRPTT